MKKANIVILAGQSNMVGVGHRQFLKDHVSKEKLAEYNEGYENVKINYYSHVKRSDGFEKTVAGGLDNYFGTIGPELSMAEYFTEKYPGEEFFVVKCAFGATDLYNEWCSPSSKQIFSYEETKHCSIIGERKTGWCYNELIFILRESIKILENDGYSPEIRGFCWMQGESDAHSMEIVDQYIWLYDNLLKDLNREFDGYFSKDCTYVDAGISEIWICYREMNERKKVYAESKENFHFIDTIGAGLTTTNEPPEKPDIYHYDVDSVLKLGRLFAEKISFS